MTIKAGSPEAHQRALKAAATRRRNKLYGKPPEPVKKQRERSQRLPRFSGEHVPTNTYGQIIRAAKRKHPNHLIGIEDGDFVSFFGQDAQAVSKELDVNMHTSRSGFYQVSFPHQTMKMYRERLLAKGFRVAEVDAAVLNDKPKPKPKPKPRPKAAKKQFTKQQRALIATTLRQWRGWRRSQMQWRYEQWRESERKLKRLSVPAWQELQRQMARRHF